MKSDRTLLVGELLNEFTIHRRRRSKQQSARKAQILQWLRNRSIRTLRLLHQLHDLLIFLRAFPDTREVLQLGKDGLNQIPLRIKSMSTRCEAAQTPVR